MPLLVIVYFTQNIPALFMQHYAFNQLIEQLNFCNITLRLFSDLDESYIHITADVNRGHPCLNFSIAVYSLINEGRLGKVSDSNQGSRFFYSSHTQLYRI